MVEHISASGQGAEAPKVGDRQYGGTYTRDGGMYRDVKVWNGAGWQYSHTQVWDSQAGDWRTV